MIKRFTAVALSLCLIFGCALADGVKILAIGNSFTRNALKYFYPMAKSAGVGDMTVANMHISGCSLKKHFRQISKNRAAYELFVNEGSGETVQKKVRMSDAIAMEDWDYIIIQQTGGHSGVVGLYTLYLKYIVNYAKKNATNPDAVIAWHGTWAYGKKCKNHSFARYSFNQKRMYDAIVHAEEVLIYPNSDIGKIIPVGRAVQMIRETAIGDRLNLPDGYHLNDTGCYAAALTWVSVIFGVKPESVPFAPEGVSQTNIALIKQSVAKAVADYSR